MLKLVRFLQMTMDLVKKNMRSHGWKLINEALIYENNVFGLKHYFYSSSIF